MANWRPSCDANLAHRHASLVTAGALGPTRLSDVRHVHQAGFVHQPHRPNQQSGMNVQYKSPRQRRHEPSDSPRLPAVPGASKRPQQQSLEDFVANPAGSPPVPAGGSTELLNMLREMRGQLEWQQNQIQGLTSEVQSLRAVVGGPQQDQPPPQMQRQDQPPPQMQRQASERAPPAEFQSPPAAHVGTSASPEAAAIRAQLQQRQLETEQMQRRLAQLEQQDGGGGGGARFVGLPPREPRAPPAAQQFPLDGRRSGAGALMSRQEKAAAAEIQAEIREMQAATTVQATNRGRIVRRELSEQKAERKASNHAATTMQAAERGRAARGRAERVSAEQAVAELEAAVGEEDGEEVEEQRRRAADLEAAAALIQGAAASALGPGSADLEAAAALIQGAAASALGPNSADLEAAAALIQGAAASVLGPGSADLEAAAALIQGAAAASIGISVVGPSSADLEAAAALIQGAAASALGSGSADLEAAAALIQGAAASVLGPSSADLEAAASLIQGAASSVLGPGSADLEAAAALLQGAAASVGISVLGA